MNIADQASRFIRALGVFLGMSDNDREVIPDHKHLEGEYRRKVLAPDLFQHFIGVTLLQDPEFERLLPTLEGEYLVRACVDGDDLKVNVYSLERFKGGRLTPAFDPEWRRSDIVNFHLVVSYDNHDKIRQRLHPVVNGRTIAKDLSYNTFAPCRSYQLPLTPDELAEAIRYTAYAQ